MHSFTACFICFFKQIKRKMLVGMNVTTASAQARTNSAGASLPAVQAILPSSTIQAAQPRTVRSITLRGPVGRLEATLNDGAPNALFAALLCHPHPLGGGTMHNKVVYHAMKALNDPSFGLSFPVLRFNFRGTGLSEGEHHGQEEIRDVLAALDWLENEFNLPVIVAGFSFGAAMALRACCTSDRARNVRALIALGLPVEAPSRTYDYSFLHNAILPKLFLSGDHDRFAPAARLKQIADSSADPKRLVLFPGADHFFTGHLEPMQRALSSWLKEQLL
jgi:uncharacterized protein